MTQYYCNYRLLKKRQEQYSGVIIEFIPSKLNDLKEDLNFLFSSETTNICLEFNDRIFYSLCKKNEFLEISVRSFLKNEDNDIYFCELCKTLYVESSEVEKQALCLLLTEINQELNKYLRHYFLK